MQVAKRDGRIMEFNKQRIVDAIVKAMIQTSDGVDRELAEKIASSIEKQLETRDEVSVYEIQDLVEKKLMVSSRKEVATAYITYRYTRDVARKSKTKNIFLDIITSKTSPLKSGDGSYKNINDMMNTFAAESIKPYVDTILLSKDVKNAENNGYIDIKNKRYYPTKAIKTFEIPLIHETEILKNCKNIESAVCNIMCLVSRLKVEVCESLVLPPIDITLKPFVKKTYKEEQKNISEILVVSDFKSNSKYDSLIEKNVVNRVYNSLKFLIQGLSSSCESDKFNYITFGTDSSHEARMITREMLELSSQKTKLKEICEETNSANSDLYELAFKVSLKNRLLTLSETKLNYSYGRGIVNAITINLPKIAYEAFYHTKDTNIGFDPDLETNEDKIIEINFLSSLKKSVFVAFNGLVERLEFQSTATKGQFPTLMSGLWIDSEKLNVEDTIGNVLKKGTLELELYGLDRVTEILKKNKNPNQIKEFKDEIIQEINNMLNEFSKEYKLNFTLKETNDNE